MVDCYLRVRNCLSHKVFIFSQWLSKDHLCILVYLVTVMHSMQAGYMDKAQKYTDKAIAQIEKLRTANFDNHPILSSFHVLLLEHTVQVWSLT